MLDLMILYILSKRENTMYSVQKFIFDNYGAYSKPSFGAIKPALKRLEKNGFINLRKNMSDGGKLSVFYSITDSGLKELKRLILEPLSENPLNYFACACIKISCSDILKNDDLKQLLLNIKSVGLQHKFSAENIISNEYNKLNFAQKIVLDNAICTYSNMISMVEGLEHAGNS